MSNTLANGLRQVRTDLLSKILSLGTLNPDGSLTLPACVVEHWIASCRAGSTLSAADQQLFALQSDLFIQFLELYLLREILFMEAP